MKSPLVVFDGNQYSVLRESTEWGITELDLAATPRRLAGNQSSQASLIRTQVDPFQTKPYPPPTHHLTSSLVSGDTWSAMSKRSLARFEAFFLNCEDPQRRLDTRPVVTLAHQVSLTRHILDTATCRRVLIGDEVGLGKTVVAGLVIQELFASNPGLRVLYLAPAKLVSNVGREFKRLALHFREWKAQDGDARLETDDRIIASIHRAVHPNHFARFMELRPWDVIVVDECHHLSDWAEGGGDAVMKYRLVRDLINRQSAESRLLLLSGTPHQAHSHRFENLLSLLVAPGESPQAAAGRVIYRTKEDVRDWDGNPLFPKRQVNPPLVVDVDPEHRSWLTAIHEYFRPSGNSSSEAIRRAAGWKCAQALQWAASSPNAGLGYLVRQALRAGWTLETALMPDAISAMRPYRSGPPDEPVESVYRRLKSEIARQVADDDLEDIEEYYSGRDEPEHDAELASLIRQGIDLVLSPRQPKWDRLWRDVLEPAGNEKIVLFAQPIETVRALATWLHAKTHQDPAVIIGGQSDEERDRQVTRFRHPQGPRFLISSRAGGEGINLQFSRRLVHLDVPWNPMEMEQRVGRVHRFGSRETILVDTIVVRDSRETQAWTVARNRLTSIAKTLVAPDRFENVFSRVMCLIPPEELQTVLISSAASPLDEAEMERLSALVDSGFRDWQNFHNRFAANQRQIRSQSAGLASWKQLRDFLIRHGNAELAAGIERTRFQQSDRQVRKVVESAEVIRLGDNSLRFVGNFDGGPLIGPNDEPVQPLGMNIPYVADVLHQCANPSLPAGAAHLRWGDEHKELRGQLGDEVVILAFARQTLQYDSIGGVRDIGYELFAYGVRPDQTVQLAADQRNILFDLSQSATVRVRPADSTLLSWAQAEETRLTEELWRPTDEALRQKMRHAVWPIVAVHLTP